MTGEDLRWELRQALQGRVGGFFRNTRAIRGMTCAVCSGPATGTRCPQCADQRSHFGDALADRVLTLTYVRANAPRLHQSAYTMKAYKRVPPSTKAADDLGLMVTAATLIHGDCATRAAGSPWSAVTFVPSVHRPGREHPAAGLARRAVGLSPAQRFPLSLGEHAGDDARTVRSDRFTVDSHWTDRVRGQHVLVVDDTWTSGSKAQSAALAVRAAGATQVTLLCIARWCRQDWPDHRALLDACTEPYDATVCPVTRGECS
jgi:hypothetical protein